MQLCICPEKLMSSLKRWKTEMVTNETQSQWNMLMYCVFLFICLSSDLTLTTHNVMEMTKGVHHSMLQYVLSASYHKSSEIQSQYQSNEQRREALISYTISTHPCMSWNLLASGLQQFQHSEAAAEVTRKYVKGECMQSLYSL